MFVEGVVGKRAGTRRLVRLQGWHLCAPHTLEPSGRLDAKGTSTGEPQPCELIAGRSMLQDVRSRTDESLFEMLVEVVVGPAFATRSSSTCCAKLSNRRVLTSHSIVEALAKAIAKVLAFSHCSGHAK